MNIRCIIGLVSFNRDREREREREKDREKDREREGEGEREGEMLCLPDRLGLLFASQTSQQLCQEEGPQEVRLPGGITCWLRGRFDRNFRNLGCLSHSLVVA